MRGWSHEGGTAVVERPDGPSKIEGEPQEGLRGSKKALRWW